MKTLTFCTALLLAAALSVSPQAQAPAGRGGGAAPARAAVNPPTSPVTGSATRGKQLYYDYACYSCHGYTGETGARAFVPNWPGTLATEASFIALLRGRADQAPNEPSTRMPNYAATTLSDAQARDIYAYIRSFKSNVPAADKIPAMNAILSSATKPYKP
jgi:mono/diheme cytochrome c family protein